MPALDFPNNPTVNQQFAAPNGVTYVWDGTKWSVLTGSGGGGGGLTAPAGPIVSGNSSTLGSIAVGSNLTLAGTFPNQTLSATGGGGGGSGNFTGMVTINANAAPPAPVTPGGATLLQLSGVDNNASVIFVDCYSSNPNNSPVLSMRRAEGTGTSPQPVNSGDLIGAVNFAGLGVAGPFGTANCQLSGHASESWSATAHGGELWFWTTPPGTNTITHTMTLEGTGKLDINRNVAPVAIASPSTILQLGGQDNTPAVMFIDAYSSNPNHGAVVSLRRARGTGGAPSATQSGDLIGAVNFGGEVSGAFGTAGAQISAHAADNFTPTTQGEELWFWTTPPGTATIQHTMTLAGSGELFINRNTGTPAAASPSTVLQLNGMDNQPAPMFIDAYSSNINHGPVVSMRKAQGTNAAPTITINGDLLGAVNFAGCLGGSLGATATAQISGHASQGWSAGNQGTVIQFWTTANNSSAITNTMTLQGNGDLTLVGTVNPSDRRIKKNIEPWRYGLDAILQLNPIAFRYNGLGGVIADGSVKVGLDADDTGAVIPEILGESGELDGTPIKAIKSGMLTYALINSIKELEARLREVETTKI